MAIVKEIDGKKKVIADQSVVDHSQLTGTQAYGAHPISAIRKLPEKLHALKEKDEELSNRITAHDEEVDAIVEKVNETLDTIVNTADALAQKVDSSIEKSQGIKLEEDAENKGRLVFTDYEGNQTSVQGGFLTDNETIELNSENLITLKKVFIDDTLIGDGRNGSAIGIKNLPDEQSIKTDLDNNKIFAVGIKDTLSGDLIDSTYIHGIESNISDNAQETNENLDKINTEIEGIKAVDTKQNADLVDIKQTMNALHGTGGYLAAYNFKTNKPTQEQLTEYALSQIPNISSATEIWNGTRVKNLSDNHLWVLNNTQDTDPVVFEWIDNGLDTVHTATNDTLGVVMGSTEDFEASIDLNGHITINGLDEAFAGVDESLSGLQKSIDATNKNVQLNADNIDTLNTNLDVTKENITNVTNDLNTTKQSLTNTQNTLTETINDLNATKEALNQTNTNLQGVSDRVTENKTTLDAHAELLAGLDTNISSLVGTKVDKTTNSNVVYGTDSSNQQVTIQYSMENTGSTIAQRNSTGTLVVASPQENNEATTKEYVDTAVTNLQTQVGSTITERLEPLEEITSILKTNGDGANYLSDDGTYKEVVTVTSDNQTITTNENKVLTAVGLYDKTNNEFRDAETIFNGTSIFLYEPGEVV